MTDNWLEENIKEVHKNMPREARIRSETGYYHIMIRGIDRQIIFKDEEDYEKFRAVFNKFRKQLGIKLLAWGMIPNHVHLLIKDTSDSLSLFFVYLVQIM